MSAAMKERLKEHLELMVAEGIMFNAGLSTFYKKNGLKADVWKDLNLDSNSNWTKNLEVLYPGQFTIKKNKLSLRKKIQANAGKGRGKRILNKKKTLQNDLDAHLDRWIERVTNFNGVAKKRSTPSRVKKKAVGKPCPTCHQQMVETKGSPFKISAEHIIPLSMGGDNTASGDFPQVVAMCHACNTARNQTVLAVKESSKVPIAEFLIRQVYDPNVSNLNREYFSLFQKYYFTITGTEVKLKANYNELLIFGGFINNQPSTLMQIVASNLENIPRKIILFVEQKDSKRIDLKSWSKFTDDIRLIPNGKENIQCSVILESRRHQENSVVCLMNPSQFNGVFGTLLGEMGVKSLDASVVGGNFSSSSKLEFSKFLPWNWFARKPKQLKSEPIVAERPKIKPERSLAKVTKSATSLSQSEPASLDTVKIEPNEILAEVSSETTTSSQSVANTPHALDWANEEQLKVISELKERLVFDISEKEQNGGNFTIHNLGRIYALHGGSAAVKEKLGFPANTKMKQMFSKLFGDSFVFSGKAPLIMIHNSVNSDSNVTGDLEQSLVKNESSGIEVIDKPSDSKSEMDEPHTLEWATDEQLEIISDIRNKLISAIHHANQQGNDFRVNGMRPMYNDYGGSAAVKEKLGMPKNTKMKDMFSKLFGNEFVFSGNPPLWVLDTLKPSGQDKRAEKTRKIDQYLSQIEATNDAHTVEVFRNLMMGLLNNGSSTCTSQEISHLCQTMNAHFKFSWDKLFSEFNLEYPVGGSEAWIQNFSTMFEMAGLEYVTDTIGKETTFTFSTNIRPLPTLEGKPTLAQESE